MTLPNEYGDDYFNVRFDPTFVPYHLLEAYIPLYDLSLEDGGANGEPDMIVSVFQSGGGDEENPYVYPENFLGADTVDFESLVFSSGDSIVHNVVNLRDLRISFNDNIPFHIAVQLLSENDEGDTLTLFFDYGIRNQDTHSGLFDGNEEEWKTLGEFDFGQIVDPNFAMWAGISTENVSVIIDPAGQPVDLSINPAYPNPFNSSTAFTYSVPLGANYTINMYDYSGRLISNLRQGIGFGHGLMQIPGTNLTSGSYIVNVSTQTDNRAIILNFIK